MRSLFSEVERRATWRRVWLALAEAQSNFGLVTEEELEGLRKAAGRENIDVTRSHEIEQKIRHDLMAEVRAYQEQAKKGGGKLHLGATSMDIEDNADILLLRKASDLILTRLANCLDAAATRVMKYKDLVCMGWTHLQPAEPTTLGYRIANYAQDLALDISLIEYLLRSVLKGKGMKGAVGTSASYVQLLGARGSSSMEKRVMEPLGIDAFGVSTQTYPRKVDFLLLSALASVGQSCHKFGLDLRVLQSPNFGEISEPIEQSQVGSSAMPFKRNPVMAERMCSLARYVSVLPSVPLMNAENTILERTLDDSANRRVTLPEAFLAIDECLRIYQRLMEGIVVYPEMIKRNLVRFGQFSGTEVLLMKLAKEGGDRQEMHERIRVHSFKAWEEVMKGNPNPLAELLASDRKLSRKISLSEMESLLNPKRHVGRASKDATDLIKNTVRPLLEKYRSRVGTGAKVRY